MAGAVVIAFDVQLADRGSGRRSPVIGAVLDAYAQAVAGVN